MILSAERRVTPEHYGSQMRDSWGGGDSVNLTEIMSS